ncbi:type II CAAX prenyl endopeptidase Rce1 family protein, partial [Candidatus Cyanaurora vandensis]|uniref:CPBP family glutamic-type intramembrane protease n=1 Tax=Candidatus Cyanaurora vandensis TaxID=2714958 RepID=UPI0037C151D7
YGLGAAAVGTSVIFALLHLVWAPSRETGWQLPGLTGMGLVLIWAVVVAGGSLNLAWGLHAGWVWGMTVLDTTGAISYSGRVPTWVTGLAGKPLAGLLGLGMLGITALILAAG